MKKYYIHGMHCDGCVRKATRLISGIAQVNLVQISLITSKVVIGADRGVSFEEVSASLSETNYRLSMEAPPFSNAFKMWFKKYLALIIVFSAIVLWTIIHQSIIGWSVHFAMHDFMGGFFLLLGTLKVISWNKFAESYQGYDPLAIKFPAYAYIYPAIEVFLGIVYQFRIGNELIWNIATTLILGTATIGIIKVLRRKEVVKCACLGGYFSIPITWFTVFENLLMIGMAIYMQIVFSAI